MNKPGSGLKANGFHSKIKPLIIVTTSALIFSTSASATSLLDDSGLPLSANSFSSNGLTSGEYANQWQIHQFNQQFSDETAYRSITKLNYQQSAPGGQWQFSLSNTTDEFHGVIGYRYNQLTLSAMAGSAQAFLRDAGSYYGVNRFGFHGGNGQSFDFVGAALDTQLFKQTHLQLGFAHLDSDNNALESRQASYAELSSGNVFARFTALDRGQQTIGYAVDAGLVVGNSEFIAQSLTTENDKRMFRLRSQYKLSNRSALMFDIGHIDNPLYYDQSRYNVLLSFKMAFDKPRYIAWNVDKTNPDAAPEEKGKKSRINRPLVIGAGVVAAAAVASSGSNDQDNSERLQAQHDAGFRAVNAVNPRSVRENREYGGWVYQNQDNTYSSTSPVRGDVASVFLPAPASVLPAGSRLRASYHTHAGPDPRFDNENFSPQDIRSDNALGIGGYLGTPGGAFKYHKGGRVTVLGRVAN